MGLFGRNKPKVVVTDEKKARDQFIKNLLKHPPTIQQDHNFLLGNLRHFPSKKRKSNLIHFCYEGKYQTVPRPR